MLTARRPDPTAHLAVGGREASNTVMRNLFDASRSRLPDLPKLPELPDMPEIPPATRGLVLAVVVWSLAWKGASLWRAARNGSKPWFVTLLLTNTLGVLDAVYLFGVGRRPRWERVDEATVRSLTGEPEQEGHPQET